jgi:sulfoxide reductase catalytic subunit YedY
MAAFIHQPRPGRLRGLSETPEERVLAWAAIDRRTLFRAAIAASAGASGFGWWRRVEAALAAVQDKQPQFGKEFFPAKRNDQFKLHRPITSEQAAGRYNNFYEFTTEKRVAPAVKYWEPTEWTLEVGGLVQRPAKFDVETLGKTFPYEERLYRHRCVETWSMAVPWVGFPLSRLLDHVRPLASARFVRFISFDHTKIKGSRRNTRGEPFPYTEGLTIAEAANELAMIVTGMYGHPLWKQHGAPVRLVVPWKYGFKSAKSLVKIELTDRQPATFWNTLIPPEYDFEANVNPAVAHPRWSQAMEWDIGTRARRPTQIYNGYGEWVASLYS